MRAPGELAFIAAAAIAVGGTAAWLLVRLRKDPAERERQRRQLVNRHGRMGDALITDVTDEIVYYSYKIRGVEYTASQDVTSLKEKLPPNLTLLVGPATLKFLPSNPSNSILICEEWSGLRKQSTQLHQGV
jgi:hypothetical protein